jgi:hypothetical protein
MRLNRRQLLRYTSLLGAGAVAGCASDEEVSTPIPDNEPREQQDNPPEQNTPAQQPETETTTEGSQRETAQLGETLVYTSGQSEQLAFAIASARLQDAIISASSGSLLSRVPEQSSYSFLLADVQLANEGEEPIYPPTSVSFVAGGQQYEQTYLAGDSSYPPSNEILPGSSVSGRIAFAVPPSDAEGRIVVNFSRIGDAVTGEWVVNLGEIERTQYNYSGNSEGDFIEFGTESTRYQIAVADVTETRQYSHSSNGYQFTEEASQGNKFVLIEVFARNTGETPVRIPGRFDMSLITGSSQFDGGYYSGSQPYEGGQISTGIERSGVVQFEVPQSASEYQLQVDLTRDITASWIL